MTDQPETNPLDATLEELLNGDHAVTVEKQVVTAPDGSEIVTNDVLISGLNAQGQPCTFSMRGMAMQPNGTKIDLAAITGYCFQCHCFFEEFPEVCRGCGKATCANCAVRREDETTWHHACDKKDRIKRFFLRLFTLGILGR